MPTRIFHILVGILMGLIVGLAYAFWAEYFDHTFKSREQVEQLLNIPCLASLPKESSHKRAVLRLRIYLSRPQLPESQYGSGDGRIDPSEIDIYAVPISGGRLSGDRRKDR
jgi:hypothetical protein